MLLLLKSSRAFSATFQNIYCLVLISCFLCTCLVVAQKLPDLAGKNQDFLVKFEFLMNSEYFFLV